MTDAFDGRSNKSEATTTSSDGNLRRHSDGTAFASARQPRAKRHRRFGGWMAPLLMCCALLAALAVGLKLIMLPLPPPSSAVAARAGRMPRVATTAELAELKAAAQSPTSLEGAADHTAWSESDGTAAAPVTAVAAGEQPSNQPGAPLGALSGREARFVGAWPRRAAYTGAAAAVPRLPESDARASLRRVAAAASGWLSRRHLGHFAVGRTLLSIHTSESTGGGGDSGGGGGGGACELAMRYSDFKQLLGALGALSRSSSSSSSLPVGAEAPFTVRGLHEDAPWDDRSRLFPEFHGESWAPIDVTDNDNTAGGGGGGSGGDGSGGIGWLLKPGAPCGALLRAVDTETGIFCEIVALEAEQGGAATAAAAAGGGGGEGGGGGVLALRAEGAAHECERPPPKNCGVTTCSQFRRADVEPTVGCVLYGAPVQCPHDQRAVLAGFTAEFRTQV